MPTDADGNLAEQLRALRLEYLAASAARIEELRQLRSDLARDQGASLSALRQAFHRLAGSGGSYGFPRVSASSREGEALLQRVAAAAAPLNEADVQAIDGAIRLVAEAFAEASQRAKLGP